MHGQERDLEALLLQLFEHVQHRVVLKGGGDDMAFAGLLPDGRAAADGLVVRLAAAGGEVDFAGLGMDDGGDLRPRFFQTLLRLLAQLVEAGGIAVVRLHTVHHGVDGGAAHLRRGRVVRVNSHSLLLLCCAFYLSDTLHLYTRYVNMFTSQKTI